MKNSSFIFQERLNDSMAFGHASNGDESPRSPAFVANGAASLVTTASDYTLFLQALIKGEGLKPATSKMMMEKAVTPDWFGRPKNMAAEHLGWGLGLALEENTKGKSIWHWGDNDDFKCFFMAYPATNEILVYMTNDENGLKAIEKVLILFFGKQTYWAVKWLN